MPDQLPRALDPMEEAAWRDLARFFRIAPRLLDEDLQRGADISLTEYTTLMSLSEAPGRRLRMTELSNHVYLSGSRTTRLVNELAASGLIRKTRSTADARGIDVSLTATGPGPPAGRVPGAPSERAGPRPQSCGPGSPAVLRRSDGCDRPGTGVTRIGHGITITG